MSDFIFLKGDILRDFCRSMKWNERNHEKAFSTSFIMQRLKNWKIAWLIDRGNNYQCKEKLLAFLPRIWTVVIFLSEKATFLPLSLSIGKSVHYWFMQELSCLRHDVMQWNISHLVRFPLLSWENLSEKGDLWNRTLKMKRVKTVLKTNASESCSTNNKCFLLWIEYS